MIITVTTAEQVTKEAMIQEVAEDFFLAQMK